MTHTLDIIHGRKSVRAYEAVPVSPEDRDTILQAAMRAPTAGNMMLYSIIEIQDQAMKDALVATCDHQPFIATAPWVLLFVADYQRWYDYFVFSGVEAFCERNGTRMRKPEEGDLLLACCDAMIAAQTAVLAAESLGIGSCYIGDIMENYETHKELFQLPKYALPVGLLCFGHPTRAQKEREKTGRFGRDFIHFKDRYRRLDEDEFAEMFAEMHQQRMTDKVKNAGISNVGELMYTRKLGADYAIEMSRSVRAMLKAWTEEQNKAR